MITASRDKKQPVWNAQGTGGLQFDYPMAVSHNMDVDNIKYTIMPTFFLLNTKCFTYNSPFLVDTSRYLTQCI